MEGHKQTLKAVRKGAPALYLPTLATAEANKRSLQGRRATDISTFMGKHTWLSPRFNSDITCVCSTLQVRVESVTIFTPRDPCKRAHGPESFRRTTAKASIK